MKRKENPKYFVSRQISYPDGDKQVEIVQGGFDYANPDMCVIRWPNLGEGQEFYDPREAVEAALSVQEVWQKVSSEPVVLTFGATGGFTMALSEMTPEEAQIKADELYQTTQKCDHCGELLGKSTYTHMYADDEEYCSQLCAENAYQHEINSYQ